MMRLVGMSFVLALLVALSGSAYAQETPSGQIAYLDEAYNVWRYDAQLESHTRLTNDSSDTRRYLWPTWATDGRLAWFSHTLEDGALTTSAWIQSGPGAAVTPGYSGAEAFNYAFWSPGNCAAGPSCRQLAILLSSQAQGMFVKLLTDGVDTAQESVTLRGGPPFYFSWSFDGGRMLWQRNSRRFDIYDANEDRLLATLDQTPGLIQAPHWSPTDDRLLLGVREPDGRTALVLVEGDCSLELASGLAGAVAFNWSPDGRHVGWREQTNSGFGPLQIADAATGELLLSSPAAGVLAFVWAPDGQRIAWLEFIPAAGNVSAAAGNHLLAQSQAALPGLRWTIMELADGTTQDSTTFYPTPELLYYMTYFDQFAQSHRLWSSDSRFLIYGEIRDSGPLVRLLDADRMTEGPRTLAPGWMGVWDFGTP